MSTLSPRVNDVADSLIHPWGLFWYYWFILYESQFDLTMGGTKQVKFSPQPKKVHERLTDHGPEVPAHMLCLWMGSGIQVGI